MRLVSIIIPVYNCSQTIERCIDSVVNQSYKNIEIIVINDGSKDDSLIKVKKYGSMITIINQKNSGVSEARNNGIRHSHGFFIMFLDGDDFLDYDFVEKLVVQSSDSDLVVGGLICFDNKKVLSTNALNCKLNSDGEMFRFLDDDNGFPLIVGPTAKLLKNSIIKKNDLRFNNDLSLGEDTCFMLDYIGKSKSAIFVNSSFYRCLIRKQSLSRTNHSNIWSIQLAILNHYDRCVSVFNADNSVLNGTFHFRSIRIALNYAVLFRWSKAEFVSLCNEISKSKILDRVKKPNNLYQKMIYVFLKNGHYSSLRTVIVLKNFIKG